MSASCISHDAVTAISRRGRASAGTLTAMSGEEERSLLYRWRAQRDRRALSRLVDANAVLVERSAAAFARLDVAREDLVQQGLVGLLTAIARFDGRPPRRLREYASAWVKLEMIRFVLAALMPVRSDARRIAAAESIARSCRSIDDRRARAAVGALVDPSPNAEEQMTAVEEEHERARALETRLAQLTAEERGTIEALHFGAGSNARRSRDGEAEWKALAKLFVAPGEPATDVHLLVGGRRRRLARAGCSRARSVAALEGG